MGSSCCARLGAAGVSLLLLSVVSACVPGGGDAGPSPDDAGSSGPHDDAGHEEDAGPVDGGRVDGGGSDAGAVDAGHDGGDVEPPDGGPLPIDAGGDGGTAPDAGVPPDADRFSIGAPGAAVDHYEAAEASAPGGLDPAVDSFFDGQGRRAFGNVVAFLSGSEDGAPHTTRVRLTFANQAPGGAFIANGTASALVEDESGVWVSERGGLTTGLINVTRLDTRVAGIFNVTLCRAEEVAEQHCDGGTKVYAGSFDVTRSPGFEPLPELEVDIDTLEFDVASGDIELTYRVTNYGTATVPTGTDLNVAFWPAADDQPPSGEATGYSSATLDAPLLPGHFVSRSASLDGVQHGGQLYLEVDEEDDIVEVDEDNNADWRDYGGGEADLEVTLDSLTHERGVAVFEFTITNPSSRPYIADPLWPLDDVVVSLYADLAAPPTYDDPVSAIAAMRPVLPAFGGVYKSRAAVFLGASPTSGNAYLTVEHEGEVDSPDPVAGPLAWTGSFFPYDSVTLGSEEAPIALGTIPVRTIGQVQDEAWYSFGIPEGIYDVLIRISATNDQGTSYVPSSTYFFAPGYEDAMGCTSLFGAKQQSCTLIASDEDGPVKLKLALPSAFSGPDQGSSFFLEVLPMFTGDLEVSIDDVDETDELLTIDYTVRNSSVGFNLPADVPIPVYFWTHLDADTLVAPSDDPFTRDQVITAEGVEYVTGGLLSGEQKSGTFLFDLASGKPYAMHDRGVAYAYVLPMHETAPQCVGSCSDLPPPVGDSDWSDNLSLGFPWGESLGDLRITARSSYMYLIDAFTRALVFELVVEDELPEGTTRVCYEVAPMLDWPGTGYDYPRRLCGDVEHGAEGYSDRVSLRMLVYNPPDVQGAAIFRVDPRNKRREHRETNNDSNVIFWKTN